jgi:glycosyltransferase involved in cell wall biosynthesis
MLGPKPFGPELFGVFAESDVLVLTSRSEGTPRVLVEARAMGCPVIASRVGGVPDSVTEGVDGLLFPSGRADCLAESLLRLAQNPPLQRELAKNGRERTKNLTIERFADTISDQIDQLAAETGRSRFPHD